MKNLIQIKREELEKFIFEQMEGPNGCNGNFTMADEDLAGEEVINTTPGSIYSTAVLFPQKKNVESDALGIIPQEVTGGLEGDEEDSDDDTTTDRNERNGALGNDVDDEDIYSLNRRFPNMIGLSCCLYDGVDIRDDLKIIISGRYYTKIKGADRAKIQVIIKRAKEEFEQFFNENEQLKDFFYYSNGKLSAFDFSDHLNDVRKLLKDINFRCAERVSLQNTSLNKLFETVEDRNRFLLSYKDRLFWHLTKVQNDQYLSDQEKSDTIKMLKEIEKYECFLSYFDDLIEMFDKKSFGFWRSHTFNKEIDLSYLVGSGSKSKTIFGPKKNSALKDVIKVNIGNSKSLSLDLWLQETANSKDLNDKDVYLKVLLQNSSTPFEEDGKHYFSIVTEDVNVLCFFGIKIEIQSNKIKPYHENGRYSDVTKEEDRLDFLYRDIKDYGVGHLCSVDWATGNNDKVDRVFSEFIPSFETPDIEPVPRNKYAAFVEQDGKMVPPPYLQNNRCLQFKWLSTLSSTTDGLIRQELLSFVNIYEVWINGLLSQVDDSDRPFAEKNIEACRKDYLRMRTNVDKILSDNDSILAFRLMNTAMFMQLLHNKKRSNFRENTPVFNEDFYRNSPDDIFVKMFLLRGVHSSLLLFY